MNQILYKSFLDSGNNVKLKSKNKKISLIITITTIILIITSIIFYIVIKINSHSNEKTSKKLISNYNIITLYSNKSNSFNNQNILNNSNNSNNDIFENNISETFNKEQPQPFVIGIIEIDKINISYPILSTVTDDLLKISPCRFYGPMPNEIGNLCIAGHNNANNTQFGKLNQLTLNDSLSIYDLNGNKKNYIIYSKQEISSNDFSCTDQNTFGYKVLTLITCNNISGKRICIKAIETNS